MIYLLLKGGGREVILEVVTYNLYADGIRVAIPKTDWERVKNDLTCLNIPYKEREDGYENKVIQLPSMEEYERLHSLGYCGECGREASINCQFH